MGMIVGEGVKSKAIVLSLVTLKTREMEADRIWSLWPLVENFSGTRKEKINNNFKYRLLFFFFSKFFIFFFKNKSSLLGP